jgi:hypothetical protein
MKRQHHQLPIEELVPYEPAVIDEAVASYRKRIRSGEKLPPVDVVEFRGRFLVKNGNNRTFAARAENERSVEARVRPAEQYEESDLEFVLKVRGLKNQIGFRYLPVVASSLMRESLIKDEMVEYGSWWSELE